MTAETMPQPDLPLLRKVWDQINLIPRMEELVQKFYEEQKTAGHLIDFGDWAKAKEVDEVWAQGSWLATNDRGCKTAACFCGWAAVISGDAEMLALYNKDEAEFDWDGYGRERLGLTPAEAVRLFSCDNDKDDIHRVLSDIFARAGERFD